MPTWSGRSSSRLTFPPLPHQILLPTSSDVCLTSERQSIVQTDGPKPHFSPPCQSKHLHSDESKFHKMKPGGFPSLRLRHGSPIHAKNLKIISELVPVRGFDRWFCLWLKVVTSGNFLVLFFFFFFDRAVLVLVMM